MKDAKIILIGAGIGGLTAALALQRRGFKVTVYEQAPQLGEVGAGLTLSPNATHALESIGIGGELARLASRPSRQGVLHYRTGQILVKEQRGDLAKKQYGADYYQIHRADVHGLLADVVRSNDPTAIQLNQSFIGLSQNGSSVEVIFANGMKTSGDVIIGCDGIKSEVRAALWGNVPPRFTGNIAWRGLVPIERLPKGFKIDPPSAAAVGVKHSMARYLVRDGTLLNYVAFAEKTGWEVESWSVRSEVSELMAEFHDWHESFRTFLAVTPPELCFKWAIHDRDPLPQWTKGRVTLLGDAAHPMLPFLGMGAASAIEDAVVLARAFQAAQTLDEALSRYEAARRERATFIQLASREAQGRLQGGKVDAYTKKEHKNEEFLGLFNYNPATVAV
ncbi:MAG: FAD-dependent oxidoreductase [Rhodospirillaceae bacterium]|nr:FAD-dependent oxidoreductase [Rhodospirillaceae bacterium]